MAFRRTDGRHNTFTDAGNNGRFASTTDQPFNVRTHSHTGFGAELDAVFGNRSNDGGLDNPRVNAHLHSFQNITASQINGSSPLEGQPQFSTMGCNQSVDYPVNITTCEIMGFQISNVDIQSGFRSLDQWKNNSGRRNASQPHSNK